MLKNRIEDIRVKTRNMDKAQKREYIITYYWHYMLIAVIMAALAALIIYHFTWGNRRPLFSLAIINQETDYGRDEKIQDGFSKAYGIKSRDISVSSDYLLSYGNIHPANANESMFERFFLSWNSGALDAVIMPESFFKYCIGKGGEFMEITDKWHSGADMDQCLYKQGNASTGIYIDSTSLAGDFTSSSKDPLLLVFMKNSSHITECMDFVKFVTKG